MSEMNPVKTVLAVAKRLASINHPRAAELFRIAQTMEQPDISMGPDGQIFDPSQESQSGPNPMIDSYVKQPDGNPQMIDDRVEHELKCILRAPKDVDESQMMNFILKIGPAMNVEVYGFNWSKKDPKSGTK